ncbi:MAG: cytochrome c [Methylococcaceae bacterium]
MKRLTFLAVLLSPILVIAEPASKIAWTPEMLEFVKKGNVAKGKELAATCAACHGETGVSSMSGYPSLAGQLATYTFKQLRDYADNSREHPLMSSVAVGLSKQDAADLAVWLSTLASPPTKRQISRPYNARKSWLLAVKEKGFYRRVLFVMAQKGKGKKWISRHWRDNKSSI